MTVFTWRLLSVVSAALFVLLAALLLCLRLLRNRYYHNFEQDELIKNVKTSNSANSIYFTSGETRKYIKKYVLCKTLYDKYVVCNFTENFKSIKYFIVQYSRRKRVISVLQVKEYGTGEASKVIALNRSCSYVNIVVGTVNDLDINTNVIRPLTVNKIRLYSFLKSFTLFLGLFLARHALIEIIAGDMFIKQYLGNLFNYIAVGGSLALAVIGYFISVKCFRSKNVKELNGGALEYDFL